MPPVKRFRLDSLSYNPKIRISEIAPGKRRPKATYLSLRRKISNSVSTSFSNNDFDDSANGNTVKDTAEDNALSRPNEFPTQTSEEWIDVDEDGCVSNKRKSLKRSYRSSKLHRREEWKKLREHFLYVGTEQLAPEVFSCCLCNGHDPNIIRCKDCGNSAYYCANCFNVYHQQCQLHKPEIWQGKIFLPHNSTVAPWSRNDHSCEECFTKKFIIIDRHGRQHKIPIVLCKSEPNVVTLLRHNLWAASPTSPSIAFHVELLEWMRALLMECQVSVKGFVNTITAKLEPVQQLKIQHIDMYKALIMDSFDEYRFHYFQKHHLQHISSDLDDGSECPICDSIVNAESTGVFALDANFGLVRKKSSGSATDNPKHAGRYFYDQQQVDNFLTSYQDVSKKGGGDCSNFQAGTSIRSGSRTTKLDETAVFGSCCRHDIPKQFMNIKHGERLGYSVFLINAMKDKYPHKEFIFIYDIACVLDSHLKKKRSDVLERVKLVLPIFHCYGHKLSCQSNYGPRKVAGLGLADGENMERMWSYLRKFSPITKEMTADHRVDLLTEALPHYAAKQRVNTATAIEHRVSRSEKKFENTNKELTSLLEAVNLSVDDLNEDLLTTWRQEEAQVLLTKSSAEDKTWKDDYILLLLKYFEARKSDNSDSLGDSEILRMEGDLKRIEKSRSTLRFEENEEFRCLVVGVGEKIRKSVISKIYKQTSERAFLLSLMPKYGYGQTVFKKIEMQLKRINKLINKSINEYNRYCYIDETVSPKEIDFQGVKSPESFIFNQHDNSLTWCSKKKILDCLELIKRSQEEILICQKDKDASVQWLKANIVKLDLLVPKFSSGESRYINGCLALILDMMFFWESILHTVNPSTDYIHVTDFMRNWLDNQVEHVSIEEEHDYCDVDLYSDSDNDIC